MSRQISRRLEDYAALFSLSPCHIGDTTWKISRTISFQREEFSRYPRGASFFPRFPVYSSIFNERRGSRSRSSTLESDLFTRMSGIHRAHSRIAILLELRNDNPACTHMPPEPASTICRTGVSRLVRNHFHLAGYYVCGHREDSI